MDIFREGMQISVYRCVGFANNAECRTQNEGIPCGDGFENPNNLVISSEAEKFVRIS